MFKFSRSPKRAQDSQFPETTMATAAGSSQYTTDVQRELVRVAFKDTMRMYGLPPEWLDCQLRNLASADGVERIQVQMVMKKWSGHVLRYAMAFEKQFIECLDRYEPHVDHTEYEWVWRYANDCDCPFPDMPAAQEWAQKKAGNDVRSTPSSAYAPLPPIAPRPMPPTSAQASAPAVPKEFDLRDIFSDLRPEDVKKP
jgi:hypothetical protein